MDLRTYRRNLALSLRKAQYDVLMMEEYVARDSVVEFACRGDVLSCDAYVGLFAWRYGYVPETDNPDMKSVTEMEYSAAEGNIPRLIFLLNEDARWPSGLKDPDSARIANLRGRLKKTCAAYFSNRDQLSVEVLAALRVLESTRFAQKLAAVVVILDGQALGPSYLMHLKEKIGAFRNSALVEIQTSPIPWWNTRLHLVAALAEELGGTKEFVFVNGARNFLTMATPTEIRRRLARRWPGLEDAYLQFRQTAPSIDSIEENIWLYPQAVRAVFNKEEEQAKEIMTENYLERELGIARDAEVVTLEEKGQAFLQREILNRPTPFVALTRNGLLEGLVDVRDLARRVANSALTQFN
jgi:hypothetical protein